MFFFFDDLCLHSFFLFQFLYFMCNMHPSPSPCVCIPLEGLGWHDGEPQVENVLVVNVGVVFLTVGEDVVSVVFVGPPAR